MIQASKVVLRGGAWPEIPAGVIFPVCCALTNGLPYASACTACAPPRGVSAMGCAPCVGGPKCGAAAGALCERASVDDKVYLDLLENPFRCSELVFD